MGSAGESEGNPETLRLSCVSGNGLRGIADCLPLKQYCGNSVVRLGCVSTRRRAGRYVDKWLITQVEAATSASGRGRSPTQNPREFRKAAIRSPSSLKKPCSIKIIIKHRHTFSDPCDRALQWDVRIVTSGLALARDHVAV